MSRFYLRNRKPSRADFYPDKNVQEEIQAESTPMQSHNVTIQPRGFFKLILTRV